MTSITSGASGLWEASARIVEKGDPERFMAVMAAPAALRPRLWPLYAFNLEVARAPWVSRDATSGPLIGAMRLQWWADVLEEIETGAPVRRHEVTTALAQVLDAEGARILAPGVEARHWDLERDAFADLAAFWAHLDATAGGLLWAAARACGAGAQAEAGVRAWGRAQGLANWLRAVPALEAEGRIPLVDGRPAAVADLARAALAGLGPVAGLGAARPVLLACWQTRALLGQVARAPGRVGQGALGLSGFEMRARLIWAALRAGRG